MSTPKKDPADKKKTGRPTAYTPEHPKKAGPLYWMGATDQDVADYFGVHVDTIYEWLKKYPEFSETKNEKATADQRVERKLYERAMGYNHKATKMALDRHGEWHTMDYIEHYPPSETALIFWLKNRQPEKWREKMEIEGGLKIMVEMPDGEKEPLA